MASIIIASTDTDYYLLLSHILSEAGFAVLSAATVDEIMHLSNDSNPIAIVLDCRAGDRLAMDACRALKHDATTFGIPAVALIGPGAEGQYLNLMKAGVDESFVRPIAPRKLIGFLERLAGLALTGPAQPGGRAALLYADIDVDLDAHRVLRAGRPIHLGPIEFRILRHLIEHAGQVCSRDALVEAAWQSGRFVDRRTVNVHIGRLRRALGESGGDIIRTVRSAGYTLDRPGPVSAD